MSSLDLRQMDAADAVSAEARFSALTAATVASWPLSFTVFEPSDMLPIACVGLREIDPGRAVAWAIFGRGIRPYMADVVLGCRKMLKICPFRRVEVSVQADYDQGLRLVKALGFEPEGLMRQFDSSGRDHWLYARVQ